MRRIAAFLAAVLALAPLAALADISIVVYPQQNPTVQETNAQNVRNERLSVGGFIYDAFGAAGSISNTTGAYGNLTCAPGTGLFVTVAPTLSNSQGRVYQTVANDPLPLPSGLGASISSATPLPADPTKVMVPGLVTATSAPIGPLTAPGGGLKTYYLVEATQTRTDTTPVTLTFISSVGSRYPQTVNTQRIDQVGWTLKAGSPAASPTPVPVDSGQVPICDVLIPNGKTQVLTGDIAMRAPFSGFVQSGNVVHVSATASPSPDAGNAAITGQMAALQLISTVGTGTAAPFVVNSTTVVTNLTAQYAQGLSPSPTPSASPPIVKTGTFPNLVYSCPTCLTGLTAGANMLVGSGATPSVAVTAAPVFTATTTGTLTASSTVTFSALLSGCLQVNGSGVVSVTSCSGGSAVAFNATTPLVVATPAGQANFTCPTCVTSVTGSGNISVTAGATPVATITNAPTFTSTVTGSAFISSTGGTQGGAGQVWMGADVSSPAGLVFNVPTSSVAGFRFDVNNSVTGASISTAGLITGTDLKASNLTSGQCVQTTTAGLLTVTGSACASGSGLLVYNISGTPYASPHFIAASFTGTGSAVSQSFSGAAAFGTAVLWGICKATVDSADTTNAVPGLTITTSGFTTGTTINGHFYLCEFLGY